MSRPAASQPTSWSPTSLEDETLPESQHQLLSPQEQVATKSLDELTKQRLVQNVHLGMSRVECVEVLELVVERGVRANQVRVSTLPDVNSFEMIQVTLDECVEGKVTYDGSLQLVRNRKVCRYPAWIIFVTVWSKCNCRLIVATDHVDPRGNWHACTSCIISIWWPIQELVFAKLAQDSMGKSQDSVD